LFIAPVIIQDHNHAELDSTQAPLESLRAGKIVNPRYISWLVVEVKK
jgi:hypothetical protein